MHYFEQDLRDEGSARLIGYVLDPTITAGRSKRRSALIICPGGAYLTIEEKEAEVVAARFLGLGYQTFVCRYLTFLDRAPLGSEEVVARPHSHHPEQLCDLMRSLAYVRARADEWDIDPDRLFVLGFSAGAHLCGMLAEHGDDPELLEAAGLSPDEAELVRPSGMVLCYPMLNARLALPGPSADPHTELFSRAFFGTDTPSPADLDAFDLVRHVRPDMPPTFVWHTAEDTMVSPADTLSFVGELLAHGVTCELHLYQRGRHGQSLCDETSAAQADDLNPEAAAWVEAAHTWMRLGHKGEALSHT